jgi:hypothetical protein
MIRIIMEQKNDDDDSCISNRPSDIRLESIH